MPEIYLFIAMCFLGVGINNYSIELPFLNSLTARGYYAFFFGLLLAYAVDKGIGKKVRLLCLLTVIVIPILIVRYPAIIPDSMNFIMTFVFFPALIIVFKTRTAGLIFKNKIWGELGKVSFNVYIWHGPCVCAMYIMLKVFSLDVNIGTEKAMVVFTSLVFVVGTISHYLLEEWLIKKLGKKLSVN